MIALYLVTGNATTPVMHLADYPSMAECQSAAQVPLTAVTGGADPIRIATRLAYICIPLPSVSTSTQAIAMAALYLVLGRDTDPIVHIADYPSLAECQSAAKATVGLIGDVVMPPRSENFAFLCLPLPSVSTPQ